MSQLSSSEVQLELAMDVAHVFYPRERLPARIMLGPLCLDHF